MSATSRPSNPVGPPTPVGSTPATSTSTERAAAVLRAVLDGATRVMRGLRVLAIAAAAAAATAWLAWALDRPPVDLNDWFARIVVLVFLLTPSMVLVLFVAGLNEIRALPQRARTLQADVRTRAGDLRERSARARRSRGLFGTLIAMVGLARLILGSRDVLSPYAVVTVALRPAILLAALFATGAALLEIPASVIALLVLAVT